MRSRFGVWIFAFAVLSLVFPAISFGCATHIVNQIAGRIGPSEPVLAGHSPAIQELRDFIFKVANAPGAVLIWGESGTGKEVAAEMIHWKSNRQKGPFIAVNCAALPENLVESELFGHEKGAFTNADAQRKGKFELAENGTLFLDEFGELPLPMQAKILRVLDGHTFERVGGTTPIQPKFRAILATNRNLKEEVHQGKFRADLYFRINKFEFWIPPLRDRRMDIPILANYFLEIRLAQMRSSGFQTIVQKFSDDALDKMTHQMMWRGNTRELINAVERAIVFGEEEEIGPELLTEFDSTPVLVDGDGPITLAARSLEALLRAGTITELADADKALLGSYLREVRRQAGSDAAAARHLRMHRGTLRRKLQEAGLEPDEEE